MARILDALEGETPKAKPQDAIEPLRSVMELLRKIAKDSKDLDESEDFEQFADEVQDILDRGVRGYAAKTSIDSESKTRRNGPHHRPPCQVVTQIKACWHTTPPLASENARHVVLVTKRDRSVARKTIESVWSRWGEVYIAWASIPSDWVPLPYDGPIEDYE
ncbi:MAG: hypothetical protein AAF989_08035 [Planctomycetota bacterium]